MKNILAVLIIIGVVFGVTQYSQVLTTPSNTSVIDVNGNVSHTFQYKISGVSTNVIFIPQGSLDKKEWFDLSPTNNIITSRSTVVTYDVKSNMPMFGVRVKWISKSGIGTTPNIGVVYMGSRY